MARRKSFSVILIVEIFDDDELLRIDSLCPQLIFGFGSGGDSGMLQDRIEEGDSGAPTCRRESVDSASCLVEPLVQARRQLAHLTAGQRCCFAEFPARFPEQR